VKQGATVTWTNYDDIPHSIVLQSLQVHSAPMDSDGSFALKFDKAGVYNYICGLHPFMKGQVVVSP
jgi:plastocyanin